MKFYCDFSGVYSDIETGRDEAAVDLRDIEGTNGYCSDDAVEKIRERIKDLPAEAAHMLDNGNYHYMSLLWLEKIKTRFDLIVFDHHTDMQEPALVPVLSCGSWVLEVLKNENIPVNKVWLIGPSETDYEAAEESFKNRIVFVSQREADRAADFPELAGHHAFGKIMQEQLPVYISIDKDVLSENELKVNWEQGSMSVSALEKFVKYICEARNVIGMDLCGEPDINTNGLSREKEKSRLINEILSALC